MSYKVSAGIKESELKSWLQKALKKYGRYGNTQAVDYTRANIAPIVMCTVLSGKEILLVKRGYGLADAEGYWSTVNGFIDEAKPVREIAKKEIKEELGVNVDAENIKISDSYTLHNPREKRKYIVFPCLITLPSKPEIVLNKEHTEFAWISRDKLESYHILEDLPLAIDKALA
jgi:8-oxo-dGTP pyrophosphatase MutT (NUDIX family)